MSVTFQNRGIGTLDPYFAMEKKKSLLVLRPTSTGNGAVAVVSEYLLQRESHRITSMEQCYGDI